MSSSDAEKYYYFSFGSNLKKKRILINCKSARLFCIGKLSHHRLAFIGPSSQRWGGFPASIIASPDESVWGAVWEVTKEDVHALDIQEGVNIGIYQRIELDIDTADKGVLRCISYAKPPGGEEGLPSHTYLTVIVTGARELGLPPDYIQKLESLSHNGCEASDEELNELIS